ncbi:ribosome-associated ATPase/putative transporter RbbA [Isosphaeraceae bacterium EP7]
MATSSRSASPIEHDKSVVSVRGVSHVYGAVRALDGLDVEVPSGCMVGLIGPDGVGKSTLMGLIAGSKRIQTGEVLVLGGDMNDAGHRSEVCPRIAYMPQGLGKNLYLELSVFENIDFFARLFGVPDAERELRIKVLLDATGLGPFPDRPAGKLSGGMKQKVGLCGALIHDPDLLILDEPTTGVDPLSRQQFWNLIDNIRAQRPGMSVLVSTAYMEEAQRFDWTIAMDAGRVLAIGTPAQLMERTSASSLEEAFVSLLPGAETSGRRTLVIPPRVDPGGEPAIQATGLTKRFGKFVAVDRVSFTIGRGEIFGFLGSNGCGKSTTMKMLTGLLPASEGEAKLFGEPVDANDLSTRNRVGYMSQAFSLYGELSVRQNLDLHAKIFDIPKDRARSRIDELVDRFGLRAHFNAPSQDLPLGLKQRLSLAVAVLHEPDMLLLDEPTSGVDPVARDEFWELLIDLSRRQGVTIFVSTHFMNEAMRCDRISLMHAGVVLACDTPTRLATVRGTKDLESAFIVYIAEAEAARQKQVEAELHVPDATKPSGNSDATVTPAPGTSYTNALTHQPGSGLSLGRTLAYSRREAQEIERDPVRLLFAFVGSALMMLAFGFGITTDVENIRFAYLDLDQSPESRAYLASFEGSRYFVRHSPAKTQEDLQLRLKSHEIEVALEVQPNFGRNLGKGNKGEITAWVDGAPTNRAESLRQYLQGVHNTFLEEYVRSSPGDFPRQPAVEIQTRFAYNPTFESIYAIVPSVPAILLILIPAILMAVSIVREKELGSIINFYVTPTRRLEFLVGKQLPYIAIGMINHVALLLMAVLLFGVPLKGSGWMLTVCALLYVTATTSLGMLVATFTSSQVAAVFITTILTILPTTQFSGLLQPVSTLDGGARVFGMLWPTTYYMHASVGAFTKGLGAYGLLTDALALAAFIPILIGLSVAGLPRQEK